DDRLPDAAVGPRHQNRPVCHCRAFHLELLLFHPVLGVTHRRFENRDPSRRRNQTHAAPSGSRRCRLRRAAHLRERGPGAVGSARVGPLSGICGATSGGRGVLLAQPTRQWRIRLGCSERCVGPSPAFGAPPSRTRGPARSVSNVRSRSSFRPCGWAGPYHDTCLADRRLESGAWSQPRSETWTKSKATWRLVVVAAPLKANGPTLRFLNVAPVDHAGTQVCPSSE